MSHQSDLIERDIDAYLSQHEQKELLRFLTCGSVDDGKSTLIGRLLHDSKMIYEDQLEAITSESSKHGTTGEKVDLALLVDGLQEEREQGITIDVAYRYFSTAKRKFIIADTPGHEQYTRNMATGASTCDLAIILIDARYGVMTQTRRHSYIASLLGIKHLIVAVNKMDTVDFDEAKYQSICDDYQAFSKKINLNSNVHFVPISALNGDNVVNSSEHTPWYTGESLMQLLETIEIAGDKNLTDFRFPVQYVNRPNLDFRGFCGLIASGIVKPGDSVKALPSGKVSTVKSVETYEGELDEAFAGQSVTIRLNDEIDVSRGDMLVHERSQLVPTNQLKARCVWMSDEALTPNKQYLFKFATKVTPGEINAIDYQIDVNTQEQHKKSSLELNDIGSIQVTLDQLVPIDMYSDNRTTGAFIIIDRFSNITVGAGMVSDVLDASEQSHKASDFEIEFNALVRKHFPHWGAKEVK